MAGKSQAQSDACLALVDTSHYVGLLSAAPHVSDDFAGNPVTELAAANGYARQAITFGAKSTNADGHTRQMSNSAKITFGPCTTSDWVQATHFGIFAAVSGGAPKYTGQLDVAKTVQVGDSAEYAIGALIVKED